MCGVQLLLGPRVLVPGQCLALNGSTGFIDIKLREPTAISTVSLEHVPRNVAFDGLSAPKDFSILQFAAGSQGGSVGCSVLAVLSLQCCFERE